MPGLNEKSIFLLDGVGALVSALFLSLVLAPLQRWVGMPIRVLYALALWAGLYAVYSLACHRFADHGDPRWLRWVMRGNLLYCCATLLCVVRYSSELSAWGYAYFLSEMVVIAGLVGIERGVVAKLSVA